MKLEPLPSAGMETHSMSNTTNTDHRLAWSTPKLQEIGNLRTLVRVGNANGKSGSNPDGSANCSAEAMIPSLGCPGAGG